MTLNSFFPVHNSLGKQIWVSVCDLSELQISDPSGVIYDSTTGGGGGGVAFGDFDANWVISATTTTLSPGTPVAVFTEASSPPSWLGDRINEVGIYAAGFIIRRVSGSSSGHYLAASGFFNSAYAVPLDGLLALDEMKTAQGGGSGPFDHYGPIDVGVVGTPDVPPAFPVGWNADWNFYIPSAASDWSVQVTPFIQRLAYPA